MLGQLKSGKLTGGFRVEFIANCLANSFALPIEVETISLLVVKGGKELLQKFWLPLGHDSTLSFMRVLKTFLAELTV